MGGKLGRGLSLGGRRGFGWEVMGKRGEVVRDVLVNYVWNIIHIRIYIPQTPIYTAFADMAMYPHQD